MIVAPTNLACKPREMSGPLGDGISMYPDRSISFMPTTSPFFYNLNHNPAKHFTIQSTPFLRIAAFSIFTDPPAVSHRTPNTLCENSILLLCARHHVTIAKTVHRTCLNFTCDSAPSTLQWQNHVHLELTQPPSPLSPPSSAGCNSRTTSMRSHSRSTCLHTPRRSSSVRRCPSNHVQKHEELTAFRLNTLHSSLPSRDGGILLPA